MVFAEYSDFLHRIQLARHELATFGINVKKAKFQIQINTSGIFLQFEKDFSNNKVTVNFFYVLCALLGKRVEI